MKLKIFIILLFLYSCGYPDIDTVPEFKNIKLTKEELFDLCELSSNDKSDIDTCIEENQKRNYEKY